MVGSYILFHNTTLINFKTSDTTIILENLSSTEGKPYIYKNIIQDTIYELKMTNCDFQHLLNEIAPEYHSDEVSVINMDVKSKKGISKRELYRIVRHQIQIDTIKN